MNSAGRSTLVALGALGAMLILPELAVSDSITATCTPGPCGSWQKTDVRVDWTVDVPSRTSDEGCGRVTLAAEGLSQRTCRAFNGAVLIMESTMTVLIDKSAPQIVGATAGISANALGWFTRPLTFSFSGSDSKPGALTSGIAACTQAPYAGPDSAAASVIGTCTDRAGNVSAPFTHTFKYDATAPVLGPLRAVAGDRMVRLLWTRPETDVEIARTPGIGGAAESVVYRGAGTSFVDTRIANLVSYSYRLITADPAGNVASRSATAVADRKVLDPVPGARVSAPPVVRWSEVRNADYYNVQLYRGKRKVLTAWPKNASYRIREKWTFQGRRLRLAPGTYRLFIWPGFGAFAKQRYGRIVGTSTFVVTK